MKTLTAARAETRRADPFEVDAGMIVVGKDVLELVSSAMYVDPMTVYREYVQNAADAVDAARFAGILAGDAPGQVVIDINETAGARSIRIRDNGIGLAWDDFVPRMTALGGSAKRGTGARGFRGVGRLAGLGYAQELIFRSRAVGETQVSELRWDGRRLRDALRSGETSRIADLIQQAVTVSRLEPGEDPEHFFEVELRGVPRQRGDRLMSAPLVRDYLAQVAPVPFSPDFTLGHRLRVELAKHVAFADLDIRVNGEGPIFRPYRDEVATGDGKVDRWKDFEVFPLPGDEGLAGIAWVLHHSYEGALPAAALVKGLRLRVGDIQVGDSNLLETLFQETRFNSWAAGEVHVLNPRIVPNGRRDNFEENTHHADLINHLGPIARDIGSRCRSSSIERKWLREFQIQGETIAERLSIIDQGGLAVAERVPLATSCEIALQRMTKIAEMKVLAGSGPDALVQSVEELRGRLRAAMAQDAIETSPLARLTPEKREMYEHLISLVYECSINRSAAKALVDRILAKVTV